MAATPPAEPTSQPAPAPQAEQYEALPDRPNLSTTDDGQSKRPRDARLLHLILSSLGVHSYQERVPLQLLDFAYRYTSGVLSDSLRLAGEGYAGSTGTSGRGGRGGNTAAADPGDGSSITISALRQAIASRMDSSFVTALPKEWMLEQAAERNRIMLPRIEKGFGVHLPPERYVLTGTPWGLLEEWEEGEEQAPNDKSNDEPKVNGANGTNGVDHHMGGMNEDEEGEGGFEDVFGEGAGADEAQ